jgi:16S rRNA (guanine527-N7)-methyltransferase
VDALSDYRRLLEPHVGPEVGSRLARFAELLERWSRTHNLVRFGSRQELVQRHLLDALAAVPHLAPRGRLLDVGSGAGLPGIPLLVAVSQWRGVLLEPRSKRWAFLCHAVREVGVEAEVVRERLQDFGGRDQRFDLITVRALTVDHRLLAWARGWLVHDGCVLVWTTEALLEGLEGLSDWRVVSSPLPCLERGVLARLKPCFT